MKYSIINNSDLQATWGFCSLAVLALAFLMILAGCSPEGPTPEPEKKQIQLIYPLGEIPMDSCCLTFRWEDNTEAVGPFTLRISSYKGLLDDPDYNPLKIEREVDTTSFKNRLLDPGVLYYWKVERQGYEAIDSFRIEDIVAPFYKTYIDTITYSESDAITMMGTSRRFLDTVRLFRRGSRLVFEDFQGEHTISGFSQSQNFSILRWRSEGFYSETILTINKISGTLRYQSSQGKDFVKGVFFETNL